MRRLKLLLPIVVAFVAGGLLADRPQSADARPKPSPAVTCRDDLARSKRELGAAQEDLLAARAEAAAAKQQLERVLARELERKRRLETELGGPIQKLR